MPLNIYKCEKCEEKFERFVHNSEDEIKCKKCGEVCKKTIGKVYSKNIMNAEDTMEHILGPEIDRVSEKISNGSDKDFLDICGEK